MSMSATDLNLTTTGPMTACPQLQVVGGNDANRTFPLGRAVFMIGRLACCELKLKHPSVALIHCVLLHAPEGLVVRDCNTETGTLVNGTLASEQALKDKDTLKIGPFTFQVQIPAGWPAAVPSSRDGIKIDGPAADGMKLLREERRRTQAFVDEQLASVRVARDELRAEEEAMEQRHKERDELFKKEQEQLAAREQELEARENMFVINQKGWTDEKTNYSEEEQKWKAKLAEAEAAFNKTKAEHAALQEHFNDSREALLGIRKEQEKFFSEKDELMAWLEQHRGMPDFFNQERETLAKEKARLEQEAVRLHGDTKMTEQQKAEHMAALQAHAEKERALEAIRSEFEQDKAKFAETLLQHQTQVAGLEARQAELTAAEEAWKTQRAAQEEELKNWMAEQRRTLSSEIEAERTARLKDLETLETRTLAELLEWLATTEGYLTNSLDAARESRAQLMTKKSRVVRSERKG